MFGLMTAACAGALPPAPPGAVSQNDAPAARPVPPSDLGTFDCTFEHPSRSFSRTTLDASMTPPVQPDYGERWFERYGTYLQESSDAELRISVDAEGRVTVDRHARRWQRAGRDRVPAHVGGRSALAAGDRRGR